MSALHSSASSFLFSRVPYSPPSWIRDAVPAHLLPERKVTLGRFPTPIHRWSNSLDEATASASGVEMWIKRDDLTSNDLSGNKVRKLEFLLAQALDGKHDSVVTIGGVQSNHCRATAVAARQLELDPYLVLRTRSSVQDDPAILNSSIVGNLLLNRFVDAEIHTVSAATYATVGSASLLAQLTEQLVDAGRNPYPIPVGGSCPLGCFGYLEAMEEIRQQEEAAGFVFDHIVFSCGSGGTAAGLAIGARLTGRRNIHAVGVCDSPDYFYSHIEDTAKGLGLDLAAMGDVREWLTLHHGAGLGYARSSTDELNFLLGVSRRSGVVLDPVYSGKALYLLATKLLPEMAHVFQRGQRVLFIHTGGTLGMYDKDEQLAPLLAAADKAPRPMLVRAPARP